MRLVPCNLKVLSFSLDWRHNTVTDILRFDVAVNILQRTKFIAIGRINVELLR